MWRSGRVLSRNLRERWIDPHLYYSFFSRHGVPNVRLRLCGFFAELYVISAERQSVNLPPIENCICGLRCIERKIRSIFKTVQSRKLKSRYGARNRFQEPSLELSSQAT
jgi:hypothetical protein